MSYKKIYKIDFRSNSLNVKLQRQYAASFYIRFLCEQKTIINIDESTLYETDTRNKGWSIKGGKNRLDGSQRLKNFNIIAGVGSKGEFFYSVNQGNNNTQTFILFLIKLC